MRQEFLKALFWVLITPLITFPLAASQTLASCSSFLDEDLVLHIPVIDYGSGAAYLWADLVFDPSVEDGIVFRVTQAGEADWSACMSSQMAVLTTELGLSIPEVLYAGLSLRADFDWLPSADGQIRFKLRDAGAMTPVLWWPYEMTSWPVIHHDPFSSDCTPIDPPTRFQPLWYHLEGNATLTPPVVDDLRNHIYITTGKNGQPNLYAYDKQGTPLWTSDNWMDPGSPEERLDACASTSSPVIDEQGNIYVGDCKWLWSSNPNGGLRWKTLLPQEDNGTVFPFVTAFFTRSGHVGGVTTAGRVAVFDRQTGQLKASHRLTGVLQMGAETSATTGGLLSDCLWSSGDPDDPFLLDETLITQFAEGFLGVGGAVANTPIAFPDPSDPKKTRIYVPAITDPAAPGDDLSLKLYRIDAVYESATDEVQLVERTDFDGFVLGGSGSATSPDLSPDQTKVFLGDANGFLRAFDADTGIQRWATSVGAMFGSTATTWDEARLIYVAADNKIKAVRQDDGQIVWEKSYDYLARDEASGIRPVPGFERIAMPAAAPVVSPNYILMPFTLGYWLTDQNDLAIWSMKSVLAVLDRDGNPAGTPHTLEDVVETAAFPDANGYVYVTHGATVSSLGNCLYNDYEFDYRDRLPQPMTPKGGIEVLRGIYQ